MKTMIVIVLVVLQNLCFAEETKRIDSESAGAVAKGLSQLYSQALKTRSIARVCILESYKPLRCDDKTNPYYKLLEDILPCSQKDLDETNKRMASKFDIQNGLLPSEKRINSLWAEIIKRLVATSKDIDLELLLSQDKEFFRRKEANAHGATFNDDTSQELCDALVVSSKVAYAELIWTAEYWFGGFIPDGVTRYGLNK